MICCIDANIFIWGYKKQGDQEMIDRASHLFNLMDERGDILMIPTVVIAEVLAPEPVEKYPVIMDKIRKNVIIGEFDLMAASIYANMFRNKIEELKKIAHENGIDNQKMKVDHLIIASAIKQGANCIYSNDHGLHTFGQKFIDVKQLPALPSKPLMLFQY